MRRVRKEFGGAGEIDERYRVDKGVDERDDPKNEFEGKGGYPAAAGLIGLHLRGGEMHVWGKLVRMIERGKRREYFLDIYSEYPLWPESTGFKISFGLEKVGLFPNSKVGRDRSVAKHSVIRRGCVGPA